MIWSGRTGNVWPACQISRLCAGSLKNCGFIPHVEEIISSPKCLDRLLGLSMAPVQWVSWTLSPSVHYSCHGVKLTTPIWFWDEWVESHLHFPPDETEFTLNLNIANLFNQKNLFTMFNVVQHLFILVRPFWSYQEGTIYYCCWYLKCNFI